MSNKIKIVILAVVALIIGIVFGATFAPKNSNLGGLVRITQDWFTAGIKAGSTGQLTISSAGLITTSGGIANTGTLTVGSAGSALSKVITGTCNIVIGTLATSSVGSGACAATGAVAGDKVFVSLASTTIAGFSLVGASASSTADQLVVVIYNDTVSATTTIPTTVKNNAQYLIVR
jgi:hypothetical protein